LSKSARLVEMNGEVLMEAVIYSGLLNTQLSVTPKRKHGGRDIFNAVSVNLIASHGYKMRRVLQSQQMV
jgi:hypothetical protein